MSGCFSVLASVFHSLSSLSMPAWSILPWGSLLAPIEITVTGCASSFFTAATTSGVMSLVGSGAAGLEAVSVAAGCAAGAAATAGVGAAGAAGASWARAGLAASRSAKYTAVL